LRRDQLQHRDLGSGEHVRGDRVLEIENSIEASLLHEGKTEYRSGVRARDVRIGREVVCDGGIVDRHALHRAHDVSQHRVGNIGGQRALVEPLHPDSGLRGRALRGDGKPFASWQEEQPALRTGVLDGNLHQSVDQRLEDDLAGHRLREAHDGREIEVFDRSTDGGRRMDRDSVVEEVRIRAAELVHFAICTPERVAVPRCAKIKLADGLEFVCQIKV